MKLTTKGRYAVTAIVDLALHAAEGPVALAEVSKRQAISLSYLEQLFSRLRKNGLVKSVRGPGGGYRLGRDADTIYISEVIAAVNENLETTACGGAQNCHGDHECLTHELWHDLGEHIHQYLAGITLSELALRSDKKCANKLVEIDLGL